MPGNGHKPRMQSGIAGAVDTSRGRFAAQWRLHGRPVEHLDPDLPLTGQKVKGAHKGPSSLPLNHDVDGSTIGQVVVPTGNAIARQPRRSLATQRGSWNLVEVHARSSSPAAVTCGSSDAPASMAKQKSGRPQPTRSSIVLSASVEFNRQRARLASEWGRVAGSSRPVGHFPIAEPAAQLAYVLRGSAR